MSTTCSFVISIGTFLLLVSVVPLTDCRLYCGHRFDRDSSGYEKDARAYTRDLPKIDAFDQQQCGQLDSTEVDQLYMMPQAYSCGEEPPHDGKSRSDHLITPNWRRKSGKHRLNGGWSVFKSLKPTAIILFEGKHRTNSSVKWRCTGVFIDQKLLLTSTSCVQRDGTELVRARVTHDNERFVSVIKLCKMQNIPRVNTSARASEVRNDLTLIGLHEQMAKNRTVCLDLLRRPKRSAVCAVISEGAGSRDGAVISPDGQKGVFVREGCPNQANFSPTDLGESCYSRADEGELKDFDGNLCHRDHGAPLICVDHCKFGLARLYLAGIVSRVVPVSGKSSDCVDGDTTARFSYIVTNVAGVKDNLINMINRCNVN